MSILDLLIIYLSLGAPFGAYRLFRNGNRPDANALFSSITAFCFWPAYAIRSAAGHLFGPERTRNASLDGESDEELVMSIDDLSDRFRSALNGSHRLIAKRLEHRFARYTELSLARRETNAINTGPSFELLTIAGHPSPRTGAAGLERRNRNRIERHLDLARLDLLAALDDLSADRREAEEIIAAAAELLGDRQILDIISARSRAHDIGSVLIEQGKLVLPEERTI